MAHTLSSPLSSRICTTTATLLKIVGPLACQFVSSPLPIRFFPPQNKNHRLSYFLPLSVRRFATFARSRQP